MKHLFQVIVNLVSDWNKYEPFQRNPTDVFFMNMS